MKLIAQDSTVLRENPSPACQSPSKIFEKPECVLYPNPAQQKFNLRVKGFAPGTVQVLITDEKGTLVREQERLLVKGEEIIPMYVLLPPGNYFVIIQQKGKKLKRNLFIID
jgi:hypothetical protein